MSSSTATIAQIRLLDRLAELGMGMVQRLHDVAQSVDDPEVVARLGVAFHHVSRSVRQSLALQVRFAGGAGPVPRTADQTPERAAAASPDPKREARESIGWNEYERLDIEEPLDDLDLLAERADDEPLDAAGFEAALEAGVARLRRGARALRPLPGSAPNPMGRRAGLMGGAAVLRVVDSS